MPAPSPESGDADVVIWRDAEGGVLAAHPRLSAPVGLLVLGSLHFRRLPDRPSVYALDFPQYDSPARPARAVRILRSMGYRVDTDPAFEPSPGSDAGSRGEPDVVFADHPRLGIVAAVTSDNPAVASAYLDLDGWQLHQGLDIYLSPTRERHQSVIDLVGTTVSLQVNAFRVKIAPTLAEAVLAVRPAPAASRRAFLEPASVPLFTAARAAAGPAAAPLSPAPLSRTR